MAPMEGTVTRLGGSGEVEIELVIPTGTRTAVTLRLTPGQVVQLGKLCALASQQVSRMALEIPRDADVLQHITTVEG